MSSSSSFFSFFSLIFFSFSSFLFILFSNIFPSFKSVLGEDTLYSHAILLFKLSFSADISKSISFSFPLFSFFFIIFIFSILIFSLLLLILLSLFSLSFCSFKLEGDSFLLFLISFNSAGFKKFILVCLLIFGQSKLFLFISISEFSSLNDILFLIFLFTFFLFLLFLFSSF